MSSLVATRIRAIVAQARCTSCGASRVACHDALAASKDPIGCCHPHDHRIDAGVLLALANEIDSVRPVAEVSPVQGPRLMSMSELLHQREVWQPKGRPLIRIADMDPEWRYNTAHWLEQRADRLAMSEQMSMLAFAMSPLGPSGDGACDAFDSAIDGLGKDPMAWLRSTPLHKALIKGLPKGKKKLARLAERAAHYSTCPGRRGEDICTCLPLVVVVQP